MLRQEFRSAGILILCHKRTDHLRKVLHSLERAKEIGDFEILFVAQDPTDSVLEVIEKSHLMNKKVIIRNIEVNKFSTKKNINSNLFFGLSELFNNQKIDFAIVLEDDVVIAEEFLVYVRHMINKFERYSLFRGVNGVSSYTGREIRNEFGKYSQGFMWGWATTREVFLKTKKFWTGDEDAHWDYFLEPFLRTGFVINPLFSLIRNVGFDETASHTKHAPELERRINQSFEYALTLDNNSWQETRKDFRMRQDYIPMSSRGIFRSLAVYLSMRLSFYVYSSGLIYFRYSHFIARKTRLSLIKYFQ